MIKICKFGNMIFFFFIRWYSSRLSYRNIKIKRPPIIWAWIMLPNGYWRRCCRIECRPNNRNVIMNWLGSPMHQRSMNHRRISTNKSWSRCSNRNMDALVLHFYDFFSFFSWIGYQNYNRINQSMGFLAERHLPNPNQLLLLHLN